MLNKLLLGHHESLRHPIQESQISPQIKINKLAHTVCAPGTGPSTGDIPFWKVNSVIDWLNPEQSEG